MRIDPATGDPERLLDGSDDELIEDARPSPNARFLASVVATCTSSGRDQYLRVTDMATHRSWTIGRHLGACQTFSSLAW